MNEQLTIACFYWNGDRSWKDGLESQYVNTLLSSAKRNLTAPHRYVCFTNEDLDLLPFIEKIPFSPPARQGCLPRLWLYGPDVPLEGRILVFDLDTVITGSLDAIAQYDGDFCVFRPPNPKFVGKRLGGGIIGYRFGTKDYFYTDFLKRKGHWLRRTLGKERIFYTDMALQTADTWQGLFPGRFVSYKREILTNKVEVDEKVSVVAFHGYPRPHQVKDKFVKEHWVI